MALEFSVVIEKDEDGYYVASVPALRGCHTQARSLDVLMERVREAIELCIKGSHHFLQHPDGRCTVVPVHRGEAIGRGLLAQILRDCDVSREELQEQL
jgi:predicted RNase H-like HicB family nuclease